MEILFTTTVTARELIGTTSTATTQQGVTYAALLTVHTLECSSLNKD